MRRSVAVKICINCSFFYINSVIEMISFHCNTLYKFAGVYSSTPRSGRIVIAEGAEVSVLEGPRAGLGFLGRGQYVNTIL